ncbi:MAG: S26 family signal peptidase [Devosia sp.]
MAATPKGCAVIRLGPFAGMVLGVLAIGGSAAAHTTPWLIWNASASVPIGLYLIEPAVHLEVTDLVVANPPQAIARFLDERGYLPIGVPLLKRVVAFPGQTICRTGATIAVGGVAMGAALARDHLGRAMPVWRGCRVLGDGEAFLMNWQVPDSVDGRYFGPFPLTSIIGRAIPLWTDEDGNGRFEWLAPTR